MQLGEMSYRRARFWLHGAGSLLVVLVFSLVLVRTYESLNRYVYQPDTFPHWLWAVELSRDLLRDPLACLRDVVWTMRNLEYNKGGALLVSPILMVLGTSRLAYETGIVLTLLFPLAAVYQALFARVLQMRNLPAWGLWVSAVVLMAHPYFLKAAALGYICSFGLIPLLSVFWLYLADQDRDRWPWRVLLMGLLLASAVIYRKWYAYWVVAFVVVVGVDTLLSQRRAGTHAWRCLWRAGLKSALLGGTAGALFFALAWPLGMFILRTDYSDIFAGYKVSSGLMDFILAQGQNLGGWFVGLSLVGFLVTGWIRETRRLTFMLGGILLCVFFLFTRTQDFAANHVYMLLPSLTLPAALGCTYILTTLRGGRRLLVGVALAALTLLAGVSLYMPAPVVDPVADALLLPTRKALPGPRSDEVELVALRDELLRLSGGQPDSVYILSSSSVLLSGHMRYAWMSLPTAEAGSEAFCATRDVDRWHGFPVKLLQSPYLLVVQPLQLHLAVEHQRVVEQPVRQIVEGVGLGRAFTKIGRDYHLDGGATASIYAKVRPLTQGDVDVLSDALKVYYPDRPYIYSYDPAGLELQRVITL